MSKENLRKASFNAWKEIFSLKIYQLDTIASFKYRKPQAFWAIFSSLLILGLGLWGFLYEFFQLQDSSAIVLFLAYFPLLIGSLAWFRWLSICNFYQGKIRSKKDARASLSMELFVTILFFYYFYFIYRVAGFFWFLGTFAILGTILFFSMDFKKWLRGK